jgi:hypothetical protein
LHLNTSTGGKPKNPGVGRQIREIMLDKDEFGLQFFPQGETAVAKLIPAVLFDLLQIDHRKPGAGNFGAENMVTVFMI